MAKPQQQAHRSLQRSREDKTGGQLRRLLAALMVVGFLGVWYGFFSVSDAEGLAFLSSLEIISNNGNSTSADIGASAGSESKSGTARKGKDGSIVVAYAITLTNCSRSPAEQHNLVDRATVLKHSIHLVSSRNPASKSKYDYRMYAFVSEEARSECAPVVVPLLERLGFRVQWKATPFSLDQIRNPILQQKIHNQGCCQEKEFLKIYTLLLPEPVAVHLDADTLVLKKLDHLYDLILDTSNQESRGIVQQHIQPHNGENDASQETLPQTIHSFFTRDYNMAMPKTLPTRVGMQGGFWVVRPNQTTFDSIVSLVVSHGDQYGTNCGWGGCKIGSARFYGGAGFQGVISYYYSYFFSGQFSRGVAKVETPPPPDPHFVELNRCWYNSMADTARKGCRLHGDVVACNNCTDTDFAQLHGAHFTLCQKPWLCGPHIEQQLCYRFHHAWHAIRQDFEQQQQSAGIVVTNKDLLVELDDPIPDPNPRKRYADRIVAKFPGHCKKKGKKGYIPIAF